jgi:hypothetical protein
MQRAPSPFTKKERGREHYFMNQKPAVLFDGAMNNFITSDR